MSAKINHGLYRLLATGRRTSGIGRRGGREGGGKRKRREEREESAERDEGSGDKKNRARRGILFVPRDRYTEHADARDGARYTCGLLNSSRFEFISSAAKPLSMRVELAVLGPGVVIIPGQAGREESAVRKFCRNGERNCTRESKRG